jgi:hypothetical protein
MKSICILLVGGVIGAVVMAVAEQPCFRGNQRAAQTTGAPAIRSYEDKYVGCLIDEIHLALMLRATHPDIVPDWLESQLEDYVEELSGPLATSSLTPDALCILEAYYTKANSPIPGTLRAAITAQQRDIRRTTIGSRLADFDKRKTTHSTGETRQ